MNILYIIKFLLFITYMYLVIGFFLCSLKLFLIKHHGQFNGIATAFALMCGFASIGCFFALIADIYCIMIIYWKVLIPKMLTGLFLTIGVTNMLRRLL